jgi:hypothetical protein
MRRMGRCWGMHCPDINPQSLLVCGDSGRGAHGAMRSWCDLPCELLDGQRSIAVLRSGAVVSGCPGSQPNQRVVEWQLISPAASTGHVLLAGNPSA